MRRFFLVCLFAFCASAHAQDHADHIFVNGKIWTGEKGQPLAEAMALRGERILAVGPNRQVRSLATPETGVTDLRGNFVAPGFNDAHWHFTAGQDVDLVDAANVQQIQEPVLKYAETHRSAEWITGSGWGYAAFPERIPHRKYLDAVVADRPVFLWERDGHMALANSKALEIAGITRETPDPEQGRIEHDASGEPTGELKESAVELVAKRIPRPSAEKKYEALKRLMEQAASYGLTSLQNASPGLDAEDMEAFERVLSEGGFKVRFYVAVPLLKAPTEQDLARFRRLRETFRGPLVKYGSAKGILDGTVDARTAAMFEPYTDGTTGIPMWTQEELNRSVALYDKEGFQIWLHAIGDKAIRMALDAYEYAAKTNGTSARRHRVEHVEVPALADYPRFKQLGVIASTQALFANPDATTLGHYAVLLGPARASHANAFKLFDDAAAMQAFGSDSPVFSMEVLRGIYCAVTRMTPEGTPAGGWYPQNRISAEAALRHFTRDAAYASYDENVKGTLAPGKLADFVVLSRDILSTPADELLKTKVLLTVMGGRETYRSADFR